MFAVIFEVTPEGSQKQEYLNIAAMLTPAVQQIDGFLENERYRRDGESGALLSLSFWRDEKSLVRWRSQELHHKSQGQGRAGVLANYRLRVGEVLLASTPGGIERAVAPRSDLTEVGDARFASVSIVAADVDASRIETGKPAPREDAWYTSITDPRTRLYLASWDDGAVAGEWLGRCVAAVGGTHYGVNVIRTYGMHERREAPQYHPPAKTDKVTIAT